MRRLLPVAALVVLAGCGGGTAAHTAAAPSPFVPAPNKPHHEAGPEGRYKTAQVLRRTALRAAPGGRVVARIGRTTEFGSDRVLGVTGRHGGWLRVVAAERRNGRAAWIRAGAVRVGATDVSITVDR